MVLSLLFLAASTTASPDATNAQMAQLYEEVCLKAFPDDRAVAALMAARGAKELSAEEVRVTMVDDPARAWRLAESDTTVWLEFPPYHACSVRWHAPQIGELSAYETIAAKYKSANAGFTRLPPMAADRGDIHIHAVAEQRPLAGKGFESLMVIDQTISNEERRDAGDTGYVIRFVHQFAPPK